MDAPLDLLLPPSFIVMLFCIVGRGQTPSSPRQFQFVSIHSSFLFCIQKERLQHRLPGRRSAALLGEAAAAVRLAGAAAAAATATAEERVPRRSPEVT